MPEPDGHTFIGELTVEDAPGLLVARTADAVFVALDPAAGVSDDPEPPDLTGWTEIGATDG